MNYKENIIELQKIGYSIINDIYSDNEVNEILNCLENVDKTGNSFLRTKDLFAIRQLLKNVPELEELLFNKKLTELISSFSKSEYFLTKAIYFDKPSESNWFVGYHQDLRISVDKKIKSENYINWTSKKNQFGVQPPIKILQDTITIRIHFDDTDANNGALKIIPESHKKGIIRAESKDWNVKKELVCNVTKGSLMLMKPLTLHASNRTTNGKRRRVIHLELNKNELTESLNWLEHLKINYSR